LRVVETIAFFTSPASLLKTCKLLVVVADLTIRKVLARSSTPFNFSAQSVY
jgi:hypothetical protein